MQKLNNLVLITDSYACNKNCPFCIAKSNQKFSGRKREEDFDRFKRDLSKLKNEGVRFKRFVLSGNGEPSFYDISDLKKILDSMVQNQVLFDNFRMHSSGNIFFEDEKFELFNNSEVPFDFNILRVAFDNKTDMSILGYKEDYLQTENFLKAKSIKLDIGLTKALGAEELFKGIGDFSSKYPNIDTIRLKLLMPGLGLDAAKQKWVNENTFDEQDAAVLLKQLDEEYKKINSRTYTNKNNTKIVFDVSGDYSKDIVWNNNSFKDYNENILDIRAIKERCPNHYSEALNFKNRIYNSIGLYSKEGEYANSITR